MLYQITVNLKEIQGMEEFHMCFMLMKDLTGEVTIPYVRAFRAMCFIGCVCRNQHGLQVNTHCYWYYTQMDCYFSCYSSLVNT